jgi:hypothetical protein
MVPGRTQARNLNQPKTTMNAQRTPSPFPTVAKRNARPAQAIDPDLLSVEHSTPRPTARRVSGKYDAVFAKLRYGSCVACEPSEMNTVANSLRKWMAREGKPGKVVSVTRDKDGRARVWMVEADK